jgi:hypothetical protein
VVLVTVMVRLLALARLAATNWTLASTITTSTDPATGR